MAAWAVGNGPVMQWSFEDGPFPPPLIDMLLDPAYDKSAWNAPFEMSVLQNVLGVEIDPSQWHCTMALAMTLALPGSLDKCGPVVDLPVDKRKDARGKALITKFCKPRKASKHKPWTRNLPEHEPWDWLDFLTYNRQDIEAERAIWNRLRAYEMNETERAIWLLDREINSKGFPVNMAYVRNAVAVKNKIKGRMIARMNELTGLSNSNSPAQLLPWLKEHGYPFDDLKKGHIERAMERAKKELAELGDNYRAMNPEEVERQEVYAEVLYLRSQSSKTSVTKYDALVRSVDTDGFLRNGFQFAGAGRTNRWAGRLFQAQNLARPDRKLEKMLEKAAEHLEVLDAEDIELVYEQPMELLSTGIRGSVQAPKGYVFADADLSAIENIVLGWMSGEQKILSVFEKKRDPYIDFGQYMYGASYEHLWDEYKNQGKGEKRQICKPGVLGCFGADTPVLTKRGWTRIVDVLDTDEVFDGTEWTTHGGVAYRGERNLLRGFGVHATSDHKIKVGKDWRAWGLAKEQPMFGKALDTAAGVFSGTTVPVAVRGNGSSAGATVEPSAWSLGRTLHEVSLPGVEGVPLGTVAATSASGSGVICSTFSQIVSTLRARGARTPRTQLTGITGVGEFVCSSIPPKRGWAIASTLSGQTGASKSTGKTTTEITSREISVSLRDPSKTQTSGPSWDIVNCGKKKSFVVLTESGPVVAHNCGYMLSAGEIFENEDTGEFEATGLLGYAWNMGVKTFTLDDSKHSVKTWRETYTEAVAYWATIERAARKCIATGQRTEAGPVEFRLEPPFLRMYLPSGRALSYCRPRIEPRKTPWGAIKDTITYEQKNDRGGWSRITTHPGKLTENADQAIARDLLAHGMLLAKKENLDIRLHVHDQILTLCREERAEEEIRILQECMTTRPSWAPTIPLKTGGFTSRIFMKD